MIYETILMALREILRNPTRSLLTTLGIVIGVGSVIAMVTLGRSVTASVQADIASMGNNMLMVMPGAERQGPARSAATPFKNSDVQAVIHDIKGLDKVAPVVNTAAQAVYGNKNWNASITGTTNDYLDVRGFKMEYGERFSESNMASGTATCIIGATVHKELFGTGVNPVGQMLRLGNVSATVIGACESKGKSTMGPDQDDFVLMPIKVVQRRFAGSTDVNMMYVTLKDESRTASIQSQIEDLLRERRHIPLGGTLDFTVEDSKEIAKTMTSVTGNLTMFLSAIAGVSLLVGGIGIMNIMLVSVTERTREIGIRLSIGARAREVMTQFLVEAATLATLGGIIGVLLGLGIAIVGTRMMGMAMTYEADVIFLAVTFSAAVGVAFGYLPARKAARLSPIESLRHE